MSKQVVKAVGDTADNTIKFYPEDSASNDLAEYLNRCIGSYKASRGAVSKGIGPSAKEIGRRAGVEVAKALRAQKANQPTRRTDNKLVNATARAGLIAEATAADNEAREYERRAEEAHRTAMRAGDREVSRHYLDREREYAAHASLHRERAAAHRRAAASL